MSLRGSAGFDACCWSREAPFWSFEPDVRPDQSFPARARRSECRRAVRAVPRRMRTSRSRAGITSALMPVDAPGPGQQLAFEVDLDRCSGCKACVAACHNLNGLDEGESWRDVGLVVGGMPELPVLQHVTSACHHCLEPACLTACPVDAYEKDPRTGIVRHLDDQCIGCQYCTLACPYDAPKYQRGQGHRSQVRYVQ